MNKFIEVEINREILNYIDWLIKQGRKPKKFIAILNGLTNDLKKIGKFDFDGTESMSQNGHLILITDPSRLTELLNIWLAHEPYKAKNERGNNYYSAPFKKYIKFRTEIKN